jgi:hypothetical protein
LSGAGGDEQAPAFADARYEHGAAGRTAPGARASGSPPIPSVAALRRLPQRAAAPGARDLIPRGVSANAFQPRETCGAHCAADSYDPDDLCWRGLVPTEDLMAQFVLINQHSAEEHSSLMEEYGQNRDKLPEAFRGEVQYCTCPRRRARRLLVGRS